MLQLESSLQYVKGVGPKLSKTLEKLDIHKIEDCFSFFPREYDDPRRLPRVAECQIDQNVTLLVTIQSVNEKKVKKNMSVIECQVSDVTGNIKAIWFNQDYLKKLFKIQQQIIIKGRVERSLFMQQTQLNVTHTEIIYSQKEYQESVGLVMSFLTHGLH